MKGYLDSPFACKAIADAIERRIRDEIESVIRERVDPTIKDIATNAAKDICKNAMVSMGRDITSYDGWRVLIKFGEHVMLDEKLES
jgi:hypothetical protein